jgi:hypothetical protein
MEMERVGPPGTIPHVEAPLPKGGSSSPVPLERMLSVYCFQQSYNLADPGAEEVLYDSITMRRFAA